MTKTIVKSATVIALSAALLLPTAALARPGYHHHHGGGLFAASVFGLALGAALAEPAPRTVVYRQPVVYTQPQVIYTQPPVVYTQPQPPVVYAQPQPQQQVVYAQPQPQQQVIYTQPQAVCTPQQIVLPAAPAGYAGNPYIMTCAPYAQPVVVQQPAAQTVTPATEEETPAETPATETTAE